MLHPSVMRCAARARLPLRPYGDHRTLLTYEARTQATDDAARNAFLRYWRVVTPGVGIVMRAALALMRETTDPAMGLAPDGARPLRS